MVGLSNYFSRKMYNNLIHLKLIAFLIRSTFAEVIRLLNESLKKLHLRT